MEKIEADRQAALRYMSMGSNDKPMPEKGPKLSVLFRFASSESVCLIASCRERDISGRISGRTLALFLQFQL